MHVYYKHTENCLDDPILSKMIYLLSKDSGGKYYFRIDGRNSSALYIDDYKVKILHTKAKQVLPLLTNFQLLLAIFFKVRTFKYPLCEKSLL